jgi:hypothetical protein
MAYLHWVAIPEQRKQIEEILQPTTRGVDREFIDRINDANNP